MYILDGTCIVGGVRCVATAILVEVFGFALGQGADGAYLRADWLFAKEHVCRG